MVTKLFSETLKLYRERQPETWIYSKPGAMGNPEGVSYKAEP